MQISHVKVDTFQWDCEPWKTGVGTSFGRVQLGVVTVETDEGVSGHAILGSSRVGADHFAPGLIEFIRPLLLGRKPAGYWHHLVGDVEAQPLRFHQCDRCHRHMFVGHQRQSGRAAHSSTTGHL